MLYVYLDEFQNVVAMSCCVDVTTKIISSSVISYDLTVITIYRLCKTIGRLLP